ncbi:hypothetical protein [Persephonella sp.]|nr:hypothetical protein [Aquificota bacterium]
MGQDINLKIKLSRVYKVKKTLVQELNNIRKELSSAVKNIYTSDTIPESTAFATFFRDQEYIRLNKFLTEQINLLEKPLSGDTEEIFENEVENINRVISETTVALMETVQKINKYIQHLTGDSDNLPLEQYIAKIKYKLEKNIDREIKKEIQPDIAKLKEKLNYIYRYEDYSEIMNFLTAYEREVNLYLSQKGIEKISRIFSGYKENLLKEISRYLEKYIKSSETRKKVIEDVAKILEEIDINRYAIHYTNPDIRRYFSGLGSDLSKLDIIVANFESRRFIGLFITGLVLFLGGLFAPLPEGYKELIVLAGFTTGVYSFIDSAFFNRYYQKKYIKEIRDKIKEEVEKATDGLLVMIKERILKSSIKAENLIISLIKRETRLVKEFENYLVNLRNSIEKHVFVLTNIKKELEYELSEED